MNKFKKNFDNDNYQNGLRVVLICILAVTLVVSINMFAGLLPTKIANIDISTGHVFSISSETEEQLRALEKPVELIYVCESGEENQNTQIMLNLYADATDRITARQVDPAFDPQEIVKYTGDTAIDNNTVIVTSGDKQQIVYYNDYYNAGSFVLEDYLNSAIKYVTGEELYVAYFTTGHDEVEPDDSTVAYLGLDGFDYRQIALMDEGGVPEDCRVLVINNIKNDITSREAEILTGYMHETVLSGTGSALSWNSYSVAGKTGSAEYDTGEYQGTHSWFVGYSNVEDPDIALAVIAEDGGTGSETAVPIAQQIFDAYYYS